MNLNIWENSPIQIVEEENNTTITEEYKKSVKSYFTINELISSTVANNLHIDNTPSPEIVAHLTELIEFLNPLREAWGTPIRVNSGYRCKALNNAIKGASPTSVHMIGYAADLYPVNNKIAQFKIFVTNYLTDKDFDQCLLEKSGTAEWVHIGLYNNQHQQRKQIKLFNV